MSILIIQHLPDSDPPVFRVQRYDPHTIAPDTATVAPPVGFPVEGAPHSDLRRELRWYLERFLDYPFPPGTERADRALDALQAWGTQAFQALFGSNQTRDFYRDATRDGHENLQLRIVGSDPTILAWPWEALYDPQFGYLAQQCHIERQLTEAGDPLPLPETLPHDRIGLGYATVHSHVKKIYKAHGVHGRAQLAARATCSCPTNQPSQPAE